MTVAAPGEFVVTWNPKQSEALLATEQHLDLEGGIRAGKSVPLVAKVAKLCVDHPGIHCLLARWSETNLDAQLKPLWRDWAAKHGLSLSWNAEEQYDEVLETGARVYLRGLKPSEETARYGKFRGLTLAFIGIDQAEELPADFWGELKGRLSQVGYPLQIMITPQPVSDMHWIAQEFPEDNSKPDHRYIRTNAYDNKRNLPDGYVEGLEASYPLGTANRRTLLEGRRGLAVHGDPVYKGYFNRLLHERPVSMNAQVPLLEAWDFGHSHPCVVWAQALPIGVFQVLGAVMGHDLYLEDFAPIALKYRAQWCPNPLEVWSTGDPAGLAKSNQGLRSSVVGILAEHGIALKRIDGANAPEMRYQAIQAISQYMRRMAMDGEPAFRVSPRAVVVSKNGTRNKPFLSDGFEAGYVWDERALGGQNATIRRPKKDGEFDHGQNCCEYLQLAFGVSQPTQTSVQQHERRALRHAQRDEDAYDRRQRAVGRTSGRGGY